MSIRVESPHPGASILVVYTAAQHMLAEGGIEGMAQGPAGQDRVSSVSTLWTLGGRTPGLPLLKVVKTRALLSSDERGWRGAQASLAQPVGVSDSFHLSSQLISNWSYPSSLALAPVAGCPSFLLSIRSN